MRKNICDMAHGAFLGRLVKPHVTLHYIKIDMEVKKIVTREIVIS